MKNVSIAVAKQNRNFSQQKLQDGEIRVSRAIWEGHVKILRRDAVKALVPVIRQIADRLEFHRLRHGNAQAGQCSGTVARNQNHCASTTCLIGRFF
jgi:hypothetical protein